ncbi:hypothetical protein [Plesiomonas shigelloides]|uniref:hypothetical protein n=1 Tax=Plesiomonas shigelloides TaxID=703 RepID=UPI0031B77BC8
MFEIFDEQKENKIFDDTDYALALRTFDIAVCEAMAVSQTIGSQYVAPYIGYSSHIFTRMNVHAKALIEAVPRSRWVKRNAVSWDLCVSASHTRALMEGFLLFSYLSEVPGSELEWQTKVNIMHMNDCARRKRLFKNFDNDIERNKFLSMEDEIKARLLGNEYFLSLDMKLRKQCLNGNVLMIPSRDEILTQLGIDCGQFNGLFDTLSNYTHILPMSFYNMEANGRGTGIRNDADFCYIIMSLLISANILSFATDTMVNFFPTVSGVRKGLKSKFNQGPKENTPTPFKGRKYN